MTIVISGLVTLIQITNNSISHLQASSVEPLKSHIMLLQLQKLGCFAQPTNKSQATTSKQPRH